MDFCGRDWPGRKVVILNGDIGELDTKRRSTQLISLNKADVMRYTIDSLSPLLDGADKAVFVRGTMAHTGGGGWLEEALAQDFDNAVRHSKDTASWYHFQGAIDGVKFDAAHHASMGRLPWTEKNAANRIAELATRYYNIELQQPAPDVVLRSHNHRYADSGENYDTWAVCLPCWQLKTEFIYRIGGEYGLPNIGGVAIVIENGIIVRKEKVVYKIGKGKRIWALKI